MHHTYSLELKKAFRNKWFFISCLIGIICAVCCLVSSILRLYEFSDIDNMMLELGFDAHVYVKTAYSTWLGIDAFSLGASMFFFLLPVTCSLVYGWSYAEEKVTGYDKLMIARCGRGTYRRAKILALFLSGGAAASIPQIVSFVMTLCFIPARRPLPEGNIYNAVFPCFLSFLFYTHPLLHGIIFIAIDFIMAGLTAVLCMTAADLIKKKWICVLCPFILFLLVEQILNAFGIYRLIGNTDYSFFYIIRGVCAAARPSWQLLLIWGIALLLISSVNELLHKKRDIL